MSLVSVILLLGENNILIVTFWSQSIWSLLFST